MEGFQGQLQIDVQLGSAASKEHRLSGLEAIADGIGRPLLLRSKRDIGRRVLPCGKGQAGLVVFHLGVRGLVDFPYGAEVIIGHSFPERYFFGGYGGKVLFQGLDGYYTGRVQGGRNIYGTHGSHIESIGKHHPHTISYLDLKAFRELVIGFPFQSQRQDDLYVISTAHKSHKYKKNP